jgi:malate synthase
MVAQREGLNIADELARFIEDEALPAAGLAPDAFWSGFAALLAEFAPRNRALLAKRDALQAKLDTWYAARKGQAVAPAEVEAYLREIGYLVPEGPDFTIGTQNVDAEVALTAGPQLVVPLSNQRYALNAANARWGSLYDALYGTDAISEEGGATRGGPYNPVRGDKVIARARAVLDEVAGLDAGSHAHSTGYAIVDGQLQVTLADGGRIFLADPGALLGWRGAAEAPSAILLRHHGLHVEIVIDREHPVGRTDPAGVADLILESAVTTIMDLEDSVAAVDAEDKVALYRNMKGLLSGELTASFEKGGKTADIARSAGAR